MWSDLYVTTRETQDKTIHEWRLKCLFQSSFLNNRHSRQPTQQKRHNNQPHSARARRRVSQSFCTRKIAGAASGQLRMTITCAKMWRRWRRMVNQINRLVTPRHLLSIYHEKGGDFCSTASRVELHVYDSIYSKMSKCIKRAKKLTVTNSRI